MDKKSARRFLSFYATVAPALETGRVTSEEAFEQLFDYAELQGIGTDQRVAMADWYGATGRYIEAHGELPPLEQTAPAAIAAELAESEKIQREDPHRYWRDEALQHRMHDLIEQGRGEVVPLATATPAHMARLGELEKMMGDHNSAYWRGPEAAANQAAYRNLLALAAPEAAPSGEAPGASSGGAPGGSAGETGGEAAEQEGIFYGECSSSRKTESAATGGHRDEAAAYPARTHCRGRSRLGQHHECYARGRSAHRGGSARRRTLAACSTKLSFGQWLQISNDANSMYRLMRIGQIHSGRGAGLRFLSLLDIVPPRFFDVEFEPVIATGSYYVRHLGVHRGWAVVDPGGKVRFEGINSEAQAQNMCHAEFRKSRAAMTTAAGSDAAFAAAERARAATDVEVRLRLAKLLGMCGGTDGERSNAVHMLGQALANSGLSWGFLAELVAVGVVPGGDRAKIFHQLLGERLADGLVYAWAFGPSEAFYVRSLAAQSVSALERTQPRVIAEAMRFCDDAKRRAGAPARAKPQTRG